MTELKAALLICCAIFCSSLDILVSGEPSFTRQWTVNLTYEPQILKLEDRHLAVGLQDNHVLVTDIDANNGTKSCEIPPLPGFIHTDLFNHVQWHTLGNGKIVLKTPMTSHDHKREMLHPKNITSDLFLIVDPLDCSNTRIIEVTLTPGLEYTNLVPYHDNFDLFYRNINDTPWRFSDEGQRLPLDYTVANDIASSASFEIQSFKPYDASEGYLCTISSPSGTALLRHLNSRFETTKEATVGSISGTVLLAVSGNVSRCYPATKLTTNRVEKKDVVSYTYICDILDADLKTVTKSQMRYFETDDLRKDLRGARFNGTPDGGAVFVLSYVDHFAGNATRFYLQRMRMDGSTREPVEYALSSLDSDYWLRDVTIEGGKNELCAFHVKRSTSYRMWIGCFDF